MDERDFAAWRSRPLDEAFAALKASETGLSTAEAQARRATVGSKSIGG